jgi:hypothetical protein
LGGSNSKHPPFLIIDYSIQNESVVGPVGDNATSMVATPKKIQEDYLSFRSFLAFFAHYLFQRSIQMTIQQTIEIEVHDIVLE